MQYALSSFQWIVNFLHQLFTHIYQQSNPSLVPLALIIQFGRTTEFFLMLKACSRTVAVTNFINRLSFHLEGCLFKALFLLAFHGFFRISNLLSTSQTTSQSHLHLVRGDVLIVHPGVTVFLKWSKTMQVNTDSRLIPLAAIPGSLLCPLQAIMQINQGYPVPDHCPMFSYVSKGKLVIILQPQARLVLVQTLEFLGLDATTDSTLSEEVEPR